MCRPYHSYRRILARTKETKTSEFEITAIYLAPQKSPLPLATMSQLAEPVIPDESACGGRDPESSESDELRYSLLGVEVTCRTQGGHCPPQKTFFHGWLTLAGGDPPSPRLRRTGKPRPYKISPFGKGGHRGIFNLLPTSVQSIYTFTKSGCS